MMSMAREKVVLNGQIQCGKKKDRGYGYRDLLLSYPAYFVFNAKTSNILGSEGSVRALLPP